MKKIAVLGLILAMILAAVGIVSGEDLAPPFEEGPNAMRQNQMYDESPNGPWQWNGGDFGECTTIQDGSLLRSDGELITTGFDEWGYNYQGRFFNGGYCDAYRDAAWCQPYKDISLVMKWNDAWISNKDCDGDGLLDRHYGFDSYIGSGAWETNTMTGTYFDEEGKECHWSSFTKIIAVPEDAYAKEGYWYTAEDLEIGQAIWGEFAVLFDRYSDSCTEDHGVLYRPEVPIGFGLWN